MGDQQYSGLQQFPWQVLRANAAENGAAAITILTGMTYNEQKANCVDLNAFFGDKFTSLIIRMFGTSFGAETYLSSEILPELSHKKGKGENLWKAIYLRI